MADKPVTWQQGTVFVGIASSCFALCLYGWSLLYGMVCVNRVEAAELIKDSRAERMVQLSELTKDIKEYQKDNKADHEKLMTLLISIRKAQ